MDSEIKELEAAIERIWEVGRGFGLDPFPTNFEIVPATGGAELVHTAGQRSFGFLGRIVGPASARFAGLGMLYAAHRIGMEIADRQPE